MSAGPVKGPNGEERPDSTFTRRRDEIADAVNAALPAAQEQIAGAEPVYPLIAFFAAREGAKLHKSLPSVYELVWGVRLHPILGEGQGVGMSCSQGMSALELAGRLRVCAARLEEIHDCVQAKAEVPAFEIERLKPRLGGQYETGASSPSPAAAGGDPAGGQSSPAEQPKPA